MSLLIEPPDCAGGSDDEPSDLAALDGFQKTLTLASGLSLAVAAPDGRCLARYSHPADRIHPACERLFSDLLEGAGEGFEKRTAPGGLSFLTHAVRLDRELYGYVVAGPVWETPPPRHEVRRLAQLLGLTEEDVAEAVRRHPAPVPLQVDRARDLVVSLAELTVQLVRDRRHHRRSLLTLATLYDIGAAVARSLELDEVLHIVLTRGAELFAAGSGSLTLLDEGRGELRILMWDGTADVGCLTRVGLAEAAHEWVARESAPLPVPGPALGVPLRVQERCLGVIRFGQRLDETPYSTHDLQVLSILAGHAASAIDNAQLYARVRRQVRELESLHQVAQSVNSSLHLQETLQQVLDNACELLGAGAASVMLLEPDGQHLTIRQSRGLPPDVVRDTRVRLGERISGRVALEGRPISLPRGRSSRGELMEAALCVPLMVDNKVVGVLNVRALSDAEEFSQEDLELAIRLASISAAALENAELHDELQHLLVDAITALANAIDARDPYTRGHSERVTEYTVLLAEKLGVPSEEVEQIRYAALLHDIGKIRIPDPILNKPGRLTEDEYSEMKLHPRYGADIMEPVRAFRPLLPFMMHHHERYDGRGYPDGIAGEAIPLAARLICVADCFDAMTTDRPYRKGMPMQVALEELVRNAGGQFDPRVVTAFLELVEEGKVQAVLEREPSQAVPRGGGPVERSLAGAPLQ